MYNVEFIRVKANPVHSGDNLRIRLFLKTSGLRKQSLKIRFLNSESTYTAIDPGRIRDVTINVQVDTRGHYLPWPVKISSRFPLGLFRSWTEFSADNSFIIYPKPLEYKQNEFYSAKEDPGGKGRSTTGADDFKGFKEYHPGDPVKHIYWKKYPATNRLMIKEFEGRHSSSQLFDWDKIKAKDKEIKISYLCYLILQAEHNQTPYGLRLPAKQIEPASGNSHKHHCLKELSLL